MARNIVSQGNLFLGNLKAQLELERQTEIISLLLKDFQENASDWLWQTDAEGHLVDVPHDPTSAGRSGAEPRRHPVGRAQPPPN